MTQKGDFIFGGFEPANTTPVPDVLFDQLLARLSGAKLKILLYIIRRTWGFKKETDPISLNQFQHGITTKDGRVLDEGCGVKDRKTLVDGLASLESDGLIVSTKAKSDEGDDATTIYGIRFKPVKVGEKPFKTIGGSGKNQPPVVGKTNYRSGKNQLGGSMEKPTTRSGKNQLGVVGKTNPQETVIQLNSLQETVIQEDNVVGASESSTDTNAASAANTPSSPSQSNHEPTPPSVTETVAPEAPTPSEPSTQQNEPTGKQPDKPSATPPNVETAKPALEPLVMPPQDAKWTPEVVVQITEVKIGRRFQEIARTVKGKKTKTQRERQLDAAKEVVKSFSREEYTKAYDHRNDDWWCTNRGTLTVCDMTANTPRGTMRLIEELENIEKDAARSKPTNPQVTEQKRSAPLIKTAEETKAYLDEVCKPAPKSNLTLEDYKKMYGSQSQESVAL